MKFLRRNSFVKTPRFQECWSNRGIHDPVVVRYQRWTIHCLHSNVGARCHIRDPRNHTSPSGLPAPSSPTSRLPTQSPQRTNIFQLLIPSKLKVAVSISRQLNSLSALSRLNHPHSQRSSPSAKAGDDYSAQELRITRPFTGLTVPPSNGLFAAEPQKPLTNRAKPPPPYLYWTMWTPPVYPSLLKIHPSPRPPHDRFWIATPTPCNLL